MTHTDFAPAVATGSTASLRPNDSRPPLIRRPRSRKGYASPGIFLAAWTVALLTHLPALHADPPSGLPTFLGETIPLTEWVSRPGYGVLVPTTTSEFYRDTFIFTDLDVHASRVDAYRMAFVAAIMQPELTKRLKTSSKLLALSIDLAAATEKAYDAAGDLVTLVKLLKDGRGTFHLDPAAIQTTLNNWQGVVKNKHFSESLGTLGDALGGVTLSLDIAGDVMNDMFLHSIISALTLERMELLESLSVWVGDTAAVEGFLLAKADVNDFLKKDFDTIKSALNSLTDPSHIVEMSQYLPALLYALGLLEGSVAASIEQVVLPYYLAYDVLKEIWADQTSVQVMCAAATLDSAIRSRALDLLDTLPGPDSPQYEAIRRQILVAYDIRFGLGYFYCSKYDEVLWGSPLDWLFALITGHYQSVQDFRSEVLAPGMESNFSWAAYILPYLGYSLPHLPTVVSCRQDSRPDTNIYVVFSENMDTSTFTNANITVRGSSPNNHLCEFSFNSSTYELTINPNADFAWGEAVTLTIGTGVKDLAGNGLAAPHSLTFNITAAPKTHIVTAVAGANGSIDPSGNLTLEEGTDASFTALPNSGYEVDKWYLDGSIDQEGGTNYTIPNVQADHFLQVTFKQSPSSAWITVTSPNGGGKYGRSNTMYITWTWEGCIGDRVKIELLKGGSPNAVIADSALNSGEYRWSVPHDQVLGTDYRVRVSSLLSTPVSDTSDGDFEITARIPLPTVIYISDANDLRNVSEHWGDPSYPNDGHYILTNDIDAKETYSWNGNAGFKPIDYFQGVFDGQGHSITNLSIRRPNDENIGMFAILGNKGVIKNLTLQDSSTSYGYVRARGTVGALVGHCDGTVINCHSSLRVYNSTADNATSYMGGLVGFNETSGLIRNSTVITSC